VAWLLSALQTAASVIGPHAYHFLRGGLNALAGRASAAGLYSENLEIGLGEISAPWVPTKRGLNPNC
jgi:hypothetical protein